MNTALLFTYKLRPNFPKAVHTGTAHLPTPAAYLKSRVFAFSVLFPQCIITVLIWKDIHRKGFNTIYFFSTDYFALIHKEIFLGENFLLMQVKNVALEANAYLLLLNTVKIHISCQTIFFTVSMLSKL